MFVEIEEGERALAEAREGLNTYRASLLNAAVTGELTADWRQTILPRKPEQTSSAASSPTALRDGKVTQETEISGIPNLVALTRNICLSYPMDGRGLRLEF